MFEFQITFQLDQGFPIWYCKLCWSYWRKKYERYSLLILVPMSIVMLFLDRFLSLRSIHDDLENNFYFRARNCLLLARRAVSKFFVIWGWSKYLIWCFMFLACPRWNSWLLFLRYEISFSHSLVRLNYLYHACTLYSTLNLFTGEEFVWTGGIGKNSKWNWETQVAIMLSSITHDPNEILHLTI